jgi:hypothetical protein
MAEEIFPYQSGGFEATYRWMRFRLLDKLNEIDGAIDDIEDGTTDLTTYFKLAGRSGGQTAYGDTASGGNLTISSTAHATKGKLLIGTSAYDEVNNRWGIGTASPSQDLSVQKTVAGDLAVRFENLSNGTSARVLTSIKGDSAGFLGFLHFSSAYNTARYGITVSNWSEIIGTGSGLIIATSTAPLVFAPNNAERARFDISGNFGIGGSTFGTNAAGVFSIKNGTAPTTGPADTVQFYSSDDAAGHTVPSFYCEGTNVVATGQADSVSSVRVKMRINGTVYTFLCI